MQQRFTHWQPFVDGESTFDFSHLNGVCLVVRDSAGVDRRVCVTFSDHCFTRPPVDGNDVAPVYPNCSRANGRFCTERYELSLGLPQLLEFVASGGDVWNSQSEHYAILRNVNFRGNVVDYVAIFSLEKIKGTEFDLHMHVRTAHHRDERPIDTYGSVRFAHLIALAIQKKRPKKNFDQRRKRP